MVLSRSIASLLLRYQWRDLSLAMRSERCEATHQPNRHCVPHGVRRFARYRCCRAWVSLFRSQPPYRLIFVSICIPEVKNVQLTEEGSLYCECSSFRPITGRSDHGDYPLNSPVTGIGPNPFLRENGPFIHLDSERGPFEFIVIKES